LVYSRGGSMDDRPKRVMVPWGVVTRNTARRKIYMSDQDVIDSLPEARSAPPMHADIEVIQAKIDQESAFVSRLQEEVARVIVGQRYMVERLLIGLVANALMAWSSNSLR